ncbi:DUF1294 domain-containing protein [Tindallia californiensis]|uniref:Uncharacterized membrane protein YsdA, DUF1294 family n=1 Tax=Tindallia californiensis TaxID=159292 RepID=A0A1H3I839_9FIRM|nr:DUF1294 domain-containing protein [Tindallia californiensis]SDY23837.1 Uncharacterized membrane protein YsdA, DUF1294 family [Tindallia californiensis]
MFLIIYYVAVVIIAFIMMGWDKKQSKKNKKRIAEKHLFLISLIGGALGVWAGMVTWRHKTQKVLFKVGVPLMVVIHMIIIARLLSNKMLS